MKSELQRLCDRLNVRIECTYGETDPKFEPDWDDKWVQQASHYACILRYAHKKATFYMIMGCAHTNEPTAADVISCVASNAQALDLTFPEWCREFGYDSDSRKAERIYKRCRQTGAKMRKLLGADFDKFARAEH